MQEQNYVEFVLQFYQQIYVLQSLPHLKWRSSQKKPSLSIEVDKSLPSLGFKVFDVMSSEIEKSKVNLEG